MVNGPPWKRGGGAVNKGKGPIGLPGPSWKKPRKRKSVTKIRRNLRKFSNGTGVAGGMDIWGRKKRNLKGCHSQRTKKEAGGQKKSKKGTVEWGLMKVVVHGEKARMEIVGDLQPEQR